MEIFIPEIQQQQIQDLMDTDGIDFPITDKKYYQLYKKTATDGIDLGQALYETKGWNSDGIDFVDSDAPVFVWGGHFNDTGYTGTFYFGGKDGSASNGFSFRVCLAVK